MSWTVACFCGTVFHPPPDRCPTCDTPLPDVSHNHPMDAWAPSAEVALEHVARVTSICLSGQGPRPAKRGDLSSS
jgi:hypothetical protein